MFVPSNSMDIRNGDVSAALAIPNPVEPVPLLVDDELSGIHFPLTAVASQGLSPLILG